jgi:class 3 adenylate cyclase/tetratricopeptide (TPR) repeat protein
MTFPAGHAERLDARTGLTQTPVMPVCATCGESSPEGAKFCPSCGERLAELPLQVRKTVTSLFCDLAGSTVLAESLDDPEAIHDVLTRYLRAMTKVIEKHGGAVEKFAGDAILGTFGAPVAHEDDALRAVRAAVEMREALSELNQELEPRWGVALQLKIGINSGEVVTGDAIAGQAMALGDPVNVAARLEQTAGPGDIILGEPTLRLVGAAVEVDDPQPLSLKGKAEQVAAYRLVSVAAEPGPAAWRFTRPMVGRTRELVVLREILGRVVSEGHAELAVIAGSAGVGKSRLVGAFIDGLGSEATVHGARCPSYGERATFWPLAEVVRAHAGVLFSDEPSAVEAKLVQAVSAITEDRGEQVWLADRIVSLAGPVSIEQQSTDPAEAFSAWSRFLERVASPRPLVLVFEDLHWAEEAFLDFLEVLADSPASILVLGTARPDLDENRLPGTAPFLRLEPLAPDDMWALVDGITKGLPSDLREWVVARAGGNPFFAEALAAMIGERGPARDGALHVPDTIEALVTARIDALPKSLRSLMLNASVVGSSIRTDLLSSMGGVERGAVEEGMSDLIKKELFRSTGTPHAYEFWHDVVREVLYKQIPRARRSAMHRAVAEWLEDQGTEESADLLAYHYGRAFELAVEAREPQDIRRHLADRTLSSAVPPARRALATADPEAAATLVARAARALSEIPAPDRDVVGEAGRILVALGKWSEAADLLSPFADSGHLLIQRELGIAMCKLHRDDPRGAAYRRGQDYLERAAARGDPDAIASLAGTWKGIDEGMVRELYRRAAEIDPADPYPLGNLLEHEVQAAGDLSPVDGMRDRIGAAIERCRRQAAEGQNLPWAYFDLGKFSLLLELPYEALGAYTKAVDLSPASFMVETSLGSLERLSTVADRVWGLTWARELLVLAGRARFAEEEAADASISPPVFIVAGGTSSYDDEVDPYRELLLEAFRDATGTVISGGTEHGVSALAGDLGDRYPRALHTLGYLPETLPEDAAPDSRYHEQRRTPGETFSPLEPLTYWDDLLNAGIRPSQVKVIGIGGGPIAAAEYGVALALGATVGLISGSGRAADEILSDPHWAQSKGLTPLAPSSQSVLSFLLGQR